MAKKEKKEVKSQLDNVKTSKVPFIQRYSKVSRFQSNDIVKIEIRESRYNVPCQVDKTNFRPSAESVRSVLLSPSGVSRMQSLYDFVDGKDTGYRPFRDVGADIVDVEEQINRIKAEAEKFKDDEAKAKEYARQIAELSKSISSGIVSAVAGDTDGETDVVPIN